MASTAHRSTTHLTPSRYNFMLLTLTTLLGIVGLGYIGAIIAYLIPPKGAGAQPQTLGQITPNGVTGPGISSEGQFKAGVAGPFVYDSTGKGDAQGVFLVQMSGNPGVTTASDYLALEQTCRHLGCPVSWVAGSGAGGGSFNCPCHGSVYSKTGAVVSGPAPAPLYKHALDIKNGQLIVGGRQSS